MNHDHNLHSNRCELCGMAAVKTVKDEHGVEHYYCEHHIGNLKSQISNLKSDKTHDKHEGHSTNMFRDRFWLSLALTVPVLLYSKTFQQLLGFNAPDFPGAKYLPIILGSIIFWHGGLVFLKSALNELKARLPGMMTLISVAIVAAYIYSVATTFGFEGNDFFWELATLITIMLLGHWLEMKSVASAQGALKELAKLLPDTAEKISQISNLKSQNDKTERVSLSELLVGDIVLVRPGAKIPADGVIVEGESSVNEAMITGESKPVGKNKDGEVIAGTVNIEGSLRVRVAKIGQDTALAGIIRLVAQAQQSRSRAQAVADKAALGLTITAVLSGGAALFGWLFAGAGMAFAMERAVTVLVIACPHALGLAVPLVTSISTTLGARQGLLVRDRMALETARKIDVVLFDKTGTLTKGEQTVVDVWAAKGFSKDDILSKAASAEADSQHPIGKAIIHFANAEKIKFIRADNFKSIPGKGVQAKVGQASIAVGNEQLFQGYQMPKIPFVSTGKTVVLVAKDKDIVGAVAVADAIRPESKQAISELKKMAVRVAMVTGDSEDVAQSVAKELNLDEYFAEVLPENKVEKVRELQKDGSRVAMVGDGVNDAPALTQANVGVAIGAGTDVAIESAGIILIKNDPRDVVSVIKLSKAAYRKMSQNLVWATGYNVIAIPLAAGALASFGLVLAPSVGAILMSISTVIVAVNAQLLKKTDL